MEFAKISQVIDWHILRVQVGEVLLGVYLLKKHDALSDQILHER